MSDFIIEEANLKFDFTLCGVPKKFDVNNNHGLHAVDFFVEKENYLLFIEVKDYQNPRSSRDEQQNNYNMLLAAGREKKSAFALKMGAKIKDSLLSLYAQGRLFTKNVVYLLFINFDDLKSAERRILFEKIMGQIPTGLNNNDRFPKFMKITFKIVDADELAKYSVTCTRNR